MFGNNPFLSKKDPLVAAVMEARKEGDLRRQAETLVNEDFGVYSRKAVIREQLAAYDAALESTYNDLKEGLSPKQEKMASLAGNKKKIDAPDLAALRSGKKLNEGPVDAGAMDGSKSLTKSAPKEDPSLPKEYPGAASSAPTANRLSNAKAAVSPIKEGKAAVRANGVTAPKEWAMKAKTPNKNAVTKAPVPGVSIAEDEQGPLKHTTKGKPPYKRHVEEAKKYNAPLSDPLNPPHNAKDSARKKTALNNPSNPTGDVDESVNKKLESELIKLYKTKPIASLPATVASALRTFATPALLQTLTTLPADNASDAKIE